MINDMDGDNSQDNDKRLFQALISTTLKQNKLYYEKIIRIMCVEATQSWPVNLDYGQTLIKLWHELQ